MRAALLTLAFLGLLGTPAGGQRTTTFEQVTVADSAIGITTAIHTGMAGCAARLETAEVRWRVGTAPTASAGTLQAVGETLVLTDIRDVQAIRWIRTGGTSGLLDVYCWPIS